MQTNFRQKYILLLFKRFHLDFEELLSDFLLFFQLRTHNLLLAQKEDED